MSRCTVTLAADPDGVFYKLRRDVAETVRGVELLFGERWAVN